VTDWHKDRQAIGVVLLLSPFGCHRLGGLPRAGADLTLNILARSVRNGMNDFGLIIIAVRECGTNSTKPDAISSSTARQNSESRPSLR
jgi:hypothetical protein